MCACNECGLAAVHADGLINAYEFSQTDLTVEDETLPCAFYTMPLLGKSVSGTCACLPSFFCVGKLVCVGVIYQYALQFPSAHSKAMNLKYCYLFLSRLS